MMPFEDEELDGFDPALIEEMLDGPPGFGGLRPPRMPSFGMPFEEAELDDFDPALMELMLDGPPNLEGRRMRWEQISELLEQGGTDALFAGADPEAAAHLRVIQALALEDAIFAMEFPDDE